MKVGGAYPDCGDYWGWIMEHGPGAKLKIYCGWCGFVQIDHKETAP